MSGRTLRDAIAVALEIVPSVELAAGDELSRCALREFLLGWIKDYAYNRGVIFEDGDLELELCEVIADLRRLQEGEQPKVAGTAETERRLQPVNDLDVPCMICNAKVGVRCTSLIDASKWREPSHARRIELARKGST